MEKIKVEFLLVLMEKRLSTCNSHDKMTVMLLCWKEAFTEISKGNSIN